MADEQLNRILMTADAVGGVWQYSLDLLSAYAERGIRSLLVIFGPAPSRTQLQAAAETPGVELVHRDYALEWMPSPWRDVDAAGEWLLQLADAFSPDIIHLNSYAHASLPFSKPVVAVAHSCVFSWWRAVHGCSPDSEWAIYRSRVRAGLMSADAVVAPSRAMSDALRREYGSDIVVRVIPNYSRAVTRTSRKKEDFCFASGRLWDQAKNLALLEEAAGSMEWPVMVAGEKRGPDGREVHKSTLTLLGPLDHQAALDFAERAAIFLHPAVYEPFGLAVLEAAQQGCCLVLSDIESLRELWADAALFVPPRDPAAWRDTIQQLIRDRPRREEMGKRARARAQSYSADITVPAYLTSYGDLLRPGAVGRRLAS